MWHASPDRPSLEAGTVAFADGRAQERVIAMKHVFFPKPVSTFGRHALGF